MGRQTAGPAEVAGLLLLLLALIGAVTPAAAEDRDADAARADAVARGAINYRVHCFNCHGPQGRGDGPVAEMLKVRPADLTDLREADGSFPSQRLAEVIDGRRDVGGHGRREMPVWGIAFRDRGRDSDQEAEVAGRIADLVAYLESIQRPAEE